jgi:hypothetical protein
MLTGMLLHVIEAAVPIDPALGFGSFHRRRHDVRNAVIFINDFDNRDARNGARIVWLAARGWVKGGAIQVDAPPVIRAGGQSRSEFS